MKCIVNVAGQVSSYMSVRVIDVYSQSIDVYYSVSVCLCCKCSYLGFDIVTVTFCAHHMMGQLHQTLWTLRGVGLSQARVLSVS